MRMIIHRTVAAGRAFVAAYVDFIHYVEGLHVAMAGSGHGAAPRPGRTPTPTEVKGDHRASDRHPEA